MHRSLFLLISGLLATSPAGAQGATFQLLESVELPVLGYTADHATVAINASGDLFVTWTGTGSGIRNVDGVFVPRVGPTEWATPQPGDLLRLGDASLGILDAVDRCHKPDVVAVGDDFLVAFPRISPTSGAARLEISRIRVTANQSATVESAAPGEGFLLDPAVTSGDAGLMPDLACLSVPGSESGSAVVTYAHFSRFQGGRHLYEIRLGTLDFTGSGPAFGQPQVLVEKVVIDTSVVPFPGGRVLPDVVGDDYGCLVLAYEEYGKVGPNWEGRIVVQRYLPLSDGSFEVLETVTLRGPNGSLAQRRPMLATSREDSQNMVAVGWMEVANAATEDVDSCFFELVFNSAASAGPVAVTDLAYPNYAGTADRRPLPVVTGQEAALLTGRVRAAGATAMQAWLPQRASIFVMLPFVTPSEPRRAAADLLEAGGLELLPMTCEASVVSGSEERRIHLLVARP